MTNELRAYIREMIGMLNDDVVFKTRDNLDLVDNTRNQDIVDKAEPKHPDEMRHDLYEVINQLIAAYDILGDDYDDPEISEILYNLKKETLNLLNKAE